MALGMPWQRRGAVIAHPIDFLSHSARRRDALIVVGSERTDVSKMTATSSTAVGRPSNFPVSLCAALRALVVVGS